MACYSYNRLIEIYIKIVTHLYRTVHIPDSNYNIKCLLFNTKNKMNVKFLKSRSVEYGYKT